jgi:hypothetical protein
MGGEMLEYEGVEVPKEAFLGLVEAFLSENYRLWLIVEDLPEKKTFGCKEKGCAMSFTVYPPDDMHTTAVVERREDAIERTYQCSEGHENTLYWVGPPKPAFMTSRR